MAFHVGQKVVFVGYAVPTSTTAGASQIKRVPYCKIGSAYTVLSISQRARFTAGPWAGPSLYLGFMDVSHGPVWHHSSGFRPIVERGTDISIFEAMLNPSDERVDA